MSEQHIFIVCKKAIMEHDFGKNCTNKCKEEIIQDIKKRIGRK